MGHKWEPQKLDGSCQRCPKHPQAFSHQLRLQVARTAVEDQVRVMTDLGPPSRSQGTWEVSGRLPTGTSQISQELAIVNI